MDWKRYQADCDRDLTKLERGLVKSLCRAFVLEHGVYPIILKANGERETDLTTIIRRLDAWDDDLKKRAMTCGGNG